MGMGLIELQHIMGSTKIDFQKFLPGETIVRQGDKCGRLLVLISGSLSVHSSSDDGTCSVSETIGGPAALQTEEMFGLFQRFTCTYKAESSVSLISIGKPELLKLASASVIFRLNLINSLSTSLQKKKYENWRTPPRDLSVRIVLFLRSRCTTLSGCKTFYIKMTSLAACLNTTRLKVSVALNGMQQRGLLTLHRGRIEVSAMQRLLAEI